MYIKKLYLENFRNIEKQELNFSEGVNILTGLNAQGKTNIIEAIWLFSAGRSFRTNNEKDHILRGKEFSNTEIEFLKAGREQTAQIKFSDKKRKQLFLNGIKVPSKEFIGNFTSVLFFPEHLDLVKEGPEVRRRFIDFAICQIKPKYFSVLSEYNKVLFQRNNALKSEDEAMLSTVTVWNERLSSLGGYIHMIRKKYIAELEKNSVPVLEKISDGKEIISLRYESFSEDSESISEAKERLLRRLEDTVEKDKILGYTSEGIHKDDISIFINGESARAFGSQGQQRSCVMAMKIGEAEIVNSICGEYPVLLFDDVFSELDKNRKEYIIEKIKGKQVIITACENIESFGNAKLFNISNGTAEEL